MANGFAARAFDFETACANGQEFGAVLTLAPFFVTLLHFFVLLLRLVIKSASLARERLKRLTQAQSAEAGADRW
jgi:hypothetical protein